MWIEPQFVHFRRQRPEPASSTSNDGNGSSGVGNSSSVISGVDVADSGICNSSNDEEAHILRE